MRKGRLLISVLGAVCLPAALIIGVAGSVYAGQISSQILQLSLSTSATGGASSRWLFNFSLPSHAVVQSIRLQVCTTALGACLTPGGFTHTDTTLASASGLGSGFVVDNTFSDSIAVKSTTNTSSPSALSSIVFDSVASPTANETFFVRMTTYSDPTYSTGIDSGMVAQIATSQVTISATVMATLTLYVGSSTQVLAGGCTQFSNAGTATVGSNSSSDPASDSGYSYFRASTNTDSGVAIRYEAAPLPPSGEYNNANSDGLRTLGIDTLNKTLPSIFFVPHPRSTTDTIVYSTSPTVCGAESTQYAANSSMGLANPYTPSATYVATSAY